MIIYNAHRKWNLDMPDKWQSYYIKELKSVPQSSNFYVCNWSVEPMSSTKDPRRNGEQQQTANSSGVQLRVSELMGKATVKENRTEMVTIQRTAIQPTIIPTRPKLKGPGTKDLQAKVTWMRCLRHMLCKTRLLQSIPWPRRPPSFRETAKA